MSVMCHLDRYDWMDGNYFFFFARCETNKNFFNNTLLLLFSAVYLMSERKYSDILMLH